MTRGQVKETIDRLFALLDRHAETSSENSRLLDRAYSEALVQEKAHRRLGQSFGAPTYKQSPQTAAKYFAIKWYHDPRVVTSALDAVQTREDCLYASALRLAMPECAAETEAIAGIDYGRDIAGERS